MKKFVSLSVQLLKLVELRIFFSIDIWFQYLTFIKEFFNGSYFFLLINNYLVRCNFFILSFFFSAICMFRRRNSDIDWVISLTECSKKCKRYYGTTGKCEPWTGNVYKCVCSDIPTNKRITWWGWRWARKLLQFIILF